MQQSFFRVGITNRLDSLHGIVQDEKWRSGTSNTTKMVKFFLQSLSSVLLPSVLFTSIFCHLLTTSFLEFSVMDILNYGHCCLIRWDVWDYVRVSTNVRLPNIWVCLPFHPYGCSRGFIIISGGTFSCCTITGVTNHTLHFSSNHLSQVSFQFCHKASIGYDGVTELARQPGYDVKGFCSISVMSSYHFV